jgi:hypothetical protein
MTTLSAKIGTRAFGTQRVIVRAGTVTNLLVIPTP